MKLDTKLKIASYVLAGILGVLLAAAGVFITSWYFWAITFVFMLTGMVDHFRGYYKAKEES